MARAKKIRVKDYDFTYPGTVAFYEGMDTEYLRALYFKKIEQHGQIMSKIASWPFSDKETIYWMQKQGEIVARQALTIQQILNSRAGK